MKKLLAILFTVVFLLSAFTAIGVSAATKSQDGIEAELTLGKSEYAAGEKIDVTLKLKNTTSAPIENVTSEIILPNGVTATNGNLKQSAITLAPDETKTISVTASKGGSAASNNSTSSNGSANNAGSPQTGDESVIIAVAAMILSGAAAAYLAFNKKAGKRMLSLLLCAVVLGGCMLPLEVSADSAKKEFTVEESFKVAGSSLTVKAVISYGSAAGDGNSSADTDNNGAADTNNPGAADTDEPEQIPTDTNPEGEEILGEGSENMPYMEIPGEDMCVTTVSIPAGGVLYYNIYRVGGMILTINDPNAYVEYNGARYDAQDGSVVIALEYALASDSVSFVFGNNGSSDASFVVSFSNPEGSYQNPTVVESMGEEVQISLEEGDEIGYYFKHYAEKTGTLRFYVNASVDSVIVVTNNANSMQINNNDEEAPLVDENGNAYIELAVTEGDEILINLCAKPNKRGKYPAADISWHGIYF